MFLNTLANKDKKPCLPNDPFIHLLGSSLIQWMIVRINIREEPKQDLQVHLGEAMLCLGEPESTETLGSGSLRRRGVVLNAEMAKFGPFHRKFPSKLKPTQPKLKI